MKTKTTILCLALATSFITPALSQGWEKSYGGAKNDIAYDIIKTSDGGFVAVGSTESFGAGGKDVFIVKINSNGVLKWTRVFGGTGNDIAYSVVQTTSGDLVIAGVTGSSGAGGNDVYLIRLNTNGTTKWTKTFGSTGNDEARSVTFSGSNLYVGGTTTLTGTSNSNFYLLKTDANGNLLWEKNYGLTGTENAYGMTKTFDGGFALAGYTTSYGNNKVYLVKVNANGDTLFTQNYNEASNSGGAAGIAETTDHGLVMTGRYYDGTGYYNAFLLKVNNNGTQVFNKISTALDDNGDNVYTTSDGGAIVAGWNGNFGWTMMLMKYDAAGTQQWRNTGYQYANFSSYGSFSGGYSVIQNGANGYISAGYTYLPSGSNADFLIVKTDAAGTSYTKPSLAASGPTTFCLPGSVTLTAPSGYASYQWTYVSTSHSLTYIIGNNTPSYPATSGGHYSCIMKTSSNDVIVSAPQYINGIIVPTATISASGPLSYCTPSQTLTLTASPSSYTMFTYQWRLNGTDISGANNYTYNPASSSGNYSIVVSNTCGIATSTDIAVNVAAPPSTPVITGYQNLYGTQCPNGTYVSGNLQVTPVTGATYQWYYNGNPVTGAPSYYATPYVNNADYTCTVTTTCGSATSLPVHVSYFVNPVNIPPLSASGPVQGCGATSVTLSWPYFSTFFQWYKDGVQIPGATSSSYFVTTSGYYLLEFDGPPCGTLYSGTQVTINSSVPASITASGPTTVCSGTVTLNAAPMGAGITYQWYKDNVSISGATASSYAAAPSGSYKCNVTQPSCGTSASNVIYIAIGAPASASITSSYSTPFCSSLTRSLYLGNPLPGQSFQWMRDGTAIPGATSTFYSTNVGGNYRCDVSNACGTLASNTITFVVNQGPPANITSASTIVCPSIPLTLTANTGAGITYQWFNGNLVSGATQQTYNATAAGTYYVRETGANGCSASSNTIALTAGNLPVVSVIPSQYPEVCKNDVVTLKTNSGAGYTFQWKKNGVNISGAADSIYTASDSGYYAAEVTNICGIVTSPLYYLKIKSLPPATISPQGPTTFCAGGNVLLNANTGTGFIYQWKKNGANISGATASSYTATAAGTYKVAVTNNNSCSKTSAGVVVSVPCREGENISAFDNHDIKAVIYPNPYNEFFTLFVEDDADKKYTVIIKDITGKVVKTQQDILPGNEIQLGENLVAGCYLVDVISNEKKKTLKIVKL